jgi:hypothetical protein
VACTDVAGFKSKPIFFKLGVWDPANHGRRYLKALTDNLAAGLSPVNRQRLRNIRNRNVGAPITVTHGGDAVCMDYLQAVLELDFIADQVDLDGARVLEIGAGYGRTAHALLSNADIAGYDVVDLPSSLELARGYLRAVLDPEQFARIRFLSTADLDALPAGEQYDLAVNVNSFEEMPASTIRNYLVLVDQRCRHLYVKNPVGKYLDASLDNHAEGREVVEMALNAGLLRDVIDIHDSEQVEANAARFVSAYQPGNDWTCVADRWAAPWSFYWQALYRRGPA